MQSDLLEGVVASLCEAYADQPRSASEDALIAAVQRATTAENFPIENIGCDIDFGAACPDGVLRASGYFFSPAR